MSGCVCTKYKYNRSDMARHRVPVVEDELIPSLSDFTSNTMSTFYKISVLYGARIYELVVTHPTAIVSEFMKNDAVTLIQAFTVFVAVVIFCIGAMQVRLDYVKKHKEE